MYKKGMSTGVNAYNRALVKTSSRFERSLQPWHEEIFYDPQTSGGLLVTVPETQSKALLIALHDGGVERAKIIGSTRQLDNSNYLNFV